MKQQFRITSNIVPALVGLLLLAVPLSHAPLCRAESPTHEAKRIRKIGKKLAKYPDGTYLRVVFRDHSQSLGTVSGLTATSFIFTDAEANAAHSYTYADVAHVQKAKTFIGEGTLHRHVPRLLYLGIAGVAAAGAAAAMMATQ